LPAQLEISVKSKGFQNWNDQSKSDPSASSAGSKAVKRSATSIRALSGQLVQAGQLYSIEAASGRRASMYAYDPILDLLNVLNAKDPRFS
jgi:hypothetical protein